MLITGSFNRGVDIRGRITGGDYSDLCWCFLVVWVPVVMATYKSKTSVCVRVFFCVWRGAVSRFS